MVFSVSIYAVDDQEYSLTSYTGAIANGTVAYINNDYCGKYVYGNGSEGDVISGLISTLGDSIRWRFTLIGNSQYTIQSMEDSSLYLASSTAVGSLSVYLVETSDPTSHDRFKWNVSSAVGGGLLISNVHTGNRLYSSGGSLMFHTGSPASGTVEYRKFVWRVADVNYYGSSTSVKQELPAGFSFERAYVFAGETITPKLSGEYDDVLWASASDFVYTDVNGNYFSVDENTGVFTAVSSSTTYFQDVVIATHKVTGQSTPFVLALNPNAVLLGVDASEPDHDHVTCLSYVSGTVLPEIGYFSTTFRTGEFSPDEVRSYLDTDSNNLFVIRCHGAALHGGDNVPNGSYILLNTDEDFPRGIYSNNNSLPTTLDLSNMQLILLIVCETAAGGENVNNLPNIMVQRGAKTVIGFEDSIYCDDASLWTEDFFDLLKSGLSVESVCNRLKMSDAYISTEMTSCIVFGDGSFRLY